MIGHTPSAAVSILMLLPGKEQASRRRLLAIHPIAFDALTDAVEDGHDRRAVRGPPLSDPRPPGIAVRAGAAPAHDSPGFRFGLNTAQCSKRLLNPSSAKAAKVNTHISGAAKPLANIFHLP